MHRGGDLVGLHFLAVDPGAGLFGHGRQFFSGTGDLRDAVTDAADQFAQRGAHALDTHLQDTQFIFASHDHVVGQITGGNAIDDGQGLLKRTGDLTGDDDRRQRAENQRKQRAGQLQRTGLLAVGLPQGDLQVIQLLGQFDDGASFLGHLGARRVDRVRGDLESLHRLAIAVQCRFQLLQAFALSAAKHGVERSEAVNGAGQLAHGRVFGFGRDTGGVAAHFIAHQHHVLAGFYNRLILLETAFVRRVEFHYVVVDRGDQVGRLHGVNAHVGADLGARLISVAHLAQ